MMWKFNQVPTIAATVVLLLNILMLLAFSNQSHWKVRKICWSILLNIISCYFELQLPTAQGQNTSKNPVGRRTFLLHFSSIKKIRNYIARARGEKYCWIFRTRWWNLNEIFRIYVEFLEWNFVELILVRQVFGSGFPIARTTCYR